MELRKGLLIWSRCPPQAADVLHATSMISSAHLSLLTQTQTEVLMGWVRILHRQLWEKHREELEWQEHLAICTSMQSTEHK